MKINIVIVLAAALIPLGLGMIWYNKMVFGKAWIKAADMTEEKTKAMNMPLVFGLTYVFSFFMAFALIFMTTHQHHVNSLFYMQPIEDPATEMGALYKSIIDLLGHSYRTFKHGALHGTIGGILTALPVLAINALFEGKGFKYIAINAGYWIVSMGIMGGIVCAYA